MGFRVRFFGVALMTFGLLGQGSPAYAQSEAEKMERLIRSPLPLDALMTDETLKQAAGFCSKKFLVPTSPCYTPITDPDHPLVHYVQEWINQLDRRLRETNPKMMNGVPTPVVVINPDDIFNAASIGSDRCFNIPVAPGFPIDKNISQTPNHSLEIRGAGKITETRIIPSIPCENIRADELEKLIALFNQNSDQCTFTLVQGELQYSKECIDKVNLSKPARSAILRINTQSNLISINAGAFTQSPSEIHFLSVIAHELGHFYSRHNAVLLPSPRFFYSGPQTGAGENRIPTPQLSTLADSFYSYDTYPPHVEKFKNQRWHPLTALFFDVANERSCPEGNLVCQKACRSAEALINKQIYPGPERTYPYSLTSLPARFEKDYLQAEARIQQCFREIPMNDESHIVLAGLARTQDLYWYDEFGLNTIQASNLADWMLEFSQRLGVIESDWQKLYREQMHLRLGRYTTEQQADELSAYYFFLMGIEPKLASLPYEAYLKNNALPRWTEWDWKTCSEAMNNGWRDPITGTSGWVPAGSFIDTHPSFCYRIFSIWEEAQHLNRTAPPANERAKSSVPMLSSAEWMKIQAIAKKTHDQEPASRR